MTLTGHPSFQVIILLLITSDISSLKLLALTVPEYVMIGTRTSLSCFWKLEEEEALYSVKWYKDGKEFFHHIPGDQEPNKKYILPGVNIMTFDSSGSNVTLSSAVLETEGRYRCEVSGERPLFLTVSDHADLKVVVTPKHGPILHGLPRDIRDNLRINCSSGLSRPATQLAWYVNGVPAPPTSVLPLQHYKYSNGLYATALGLNIKLSDYPTSKIDLRIKCLATIASIYWKSNETNIFAAWKRSEHNLTIVIRGRKNNKRSSSINAAQFHISTFHLIMSIYILCNLNIS